MWATLPYLIAPVAVFAIFAMFAVFAVFAIFAVFAGVLMGIGYLRTRMESFLSVSLYGQFPALLGGFAPDQPNKIGQPQPLQGVALRVAPTRLSCLSHRE